ncbi:MAG: hypothetical protein J6T02_01815 [Bacteroidales bacterium]|nr:hypothetical protein [Bacteroidales bacterium]
MKPRYSEIRTIEELDRAIARNHDAIRHKETVLSRRYERVRESLTPSALLTEGMRQIVGFLPLPEFAFRFLGRLFRRK